MSAVIDPAVADDNAVDGAVESGAHARRRRWLRDNQPWLAPTVVAVLNAIAFGIVAPNVNDIFAAVARAAAVLHGVGLKYWFSWYGGGSTPATYSVLTPYLSAAIGAVALAAVAAALCTPVSWLVLRGTSYPRAGIWLVTLTSALNLWSGRVPFALGCLLGLATLAALRAGRSWLTAAFGLLAVAASPVSGAFVLLGLSGLFLSRPDWRRRVGLAAAPVVVCLIGVAVLFGQPGPESFSCYQLVQYEGALGGFLLFSRPPAWMRTSLYVSALAGLAVFVIPSGMGDNILRLATYCLPAAVVALSTRRRLVVALLGVTVALTLSVKTTVGDLVAGSEATASPDYYPTLVAELAKRQASLRNCRLEVVEDGTHTASYALLDHAMLARGYEYQEDNALNAVLAEPTLGPTAYKIWLQDNAVCYVAISSTERKSSPEYRLVSGNRPGYLAEVWRDPKWTLFRVANPNPIVAAPVSVVRFTQSTLVLRVPCACTFGVRVRKPENLNAQTVVPPGSTVEPVRGRLEPDGFGWTQMTTTRPGVYVLSGTI